MSTLGKLATLLVIAALAASSLMAIQSCHAETNLTIPEFSVKYQDNSYIVPSMQTIDPYMGNTVTIPSCMVTNRTITFTIKNQPGSMLYFNIRVKGYFEQEWQTLYGWENSPHQSETEYTTLVFTSAGDEFSRNGGGEFCAPQGGKIDFQVQAFIGYSARGTPQYDGDIIGTMYYFTTTSKSEWSNTQTLKIQNGATGTADTSTTQTELISQSGAMFFFQNTTSIAFGVSLILIGVVLVAMAVSRKRRSHKIS